MLIKKMTRLIPALAMAAFLTEAVPAEAAELAQAGRPALNVKVQAHCDKGTAVFRIQNLGGKWQKRAQLKVTDPAGRRTLVRRTVRMAENQVTTVKVRNAGRYGDAVRLWIDSNWGNPSKDAEARILCK